MLPEDNNLGDEYERTGLQRKVNLKVLGITRSEFEYLKEKIWELKLEAWKGGYISGKGFWKKAHKKIKPRVNSIELHIQNFLENLIKE